MNNRSASRVGSRRNPRPREVLLAELKEWGLDEGFINWLEGHQPKTAADIKRDAMALERLAKVQAALERAKKCASQAGMLEALTSELSRAEWQVVIAQNFELDRQGGFEIMNRGGKDWLKRRNAGPGATPTDLASYYWRGALVPYFLFATKKPHWTWVDDWLSCKKVNSDSKSRVWWASVSRPWKKSAIERPGPQVLGRAAFAWIFYKRNIGEWRDLKELPRWQENALRKLKQPWSKEERDNLRQIGERLPFLRVVVRQAKSYYELPRVLWFDRTAAATVKVKRLPV